MDSRSEIQAALRDKSFLMQSATQVPVLSGGSLIRRACHRASRFDCCTSPLLSIRGSGNSRLGSVMPPSLRLRQVYHQ